jgi:hypothetical protein
MNDEQVKDIEDIIELFNEGTVNLTASIVAVILIIRSADRLDGLFSVLDERFSNELKKAVFLFRSGENLNFVGCTEEEHEMVCKGVKKLSDWID